MSANADAIGDLLDVMRRLRDPGGCAWDREQTFATIAPFTIEEAYEVADAIERGDMADLKDELGDLLFQVVFHARMASEAGAFDFSDVVRAVTGKMVRRHPHVFAGQAERTADEQTRAWEATKAVERARQRGDDASVLDGVAMALPALTRAVKLSRRAARVGFVWPDVDAILIKLEEEIAELRVELAAGDKAAAKAEL
ncbi:MAG: nucleoside triphosphate pyrophosphohydrolase, partial [Caulobacteraceae bacterium]